MSTGRNRDSTIDLGRLSTMDAGRASRLLGDVREATLSGVRPLVLPRPEIGESWRRMLRDGLDPERDVRVGLLGADEVARRRRSSPLLPVLPVLREALATVAHEARHIMVVSDADGRILWREGHAGVLRKGDRLGFEVGAHWAEDVVGTNGVGTPLVTRRPVQVFSAEHFVRSHHTWTCAGAPVTDPRDGHLLGVVDVSGPLESMHPATLSWVWSVAQLAQARLRERHVASLERLRTLAAPVLARIGGRAVAVDPYGWAAAVTGMPAPDRVALPGSLAQGACWIPSFGACTVTALSGGWLILVDDVEPPAPARLVLDLREPRRWSLEASGAAASWTHELSARHAELLYLLARHRDGRSAAELAADLLGDPTRTVTVRAELSRVRRYLGAFLVHRPYRFVDDTEVEVLLPDNPGDLLPHSTAPAVVRARGAGTP